MYVIRINDFAESGMTVVNFINIPFSIPKGQFLFLNPLLNAGRRLEVCGILKHQYWAPFSWESMAVSAFLAFAVWTSSMTYLAFGKGELQIANHFLSLYSYFCPCYLIVYHSFLSISLIHNSSCTELLTFRYDKTKNLNWMNSESWFVKEGTQSCKLL